jgi:hypothetical protein
MSAIVTVLSENIPHVHHLHCQRIKYSSFVGWVLVRPSIEVEICIGGFVVHCVSQRTVGSSVNIYVQEGEMACLFRLHGELNALQNAV